MMLAGTMAARVDLFLPSVFSAMMLIPADWHPAHSSLYPYAARHRFKTPLGVPRP